MSDKHMFRVTLRVSAYQLSDILAFVDTRSELVSIMPEASIVPVPPKERNPSQRHRTRAHTSRDVVVEFLKSNPRSDLPAMRAAIIAAGYSSNTISPAISELRKDKRIVLHSDGTYTASNK